MERNKKSRVRGTGSVWARGERTVGDGCEILHAVIWVSLGDI